ncbi:MAG TPA: LCP family protein [Dehalococcoidia bacterium]|nr:LCP family protein [Dehalococcoidia bacterium]
MVCGILALAAGAFYTALVVVTQIDHIFFPDSEIHLGKGFSVLPGVDAGGNSGNSENGGRRINILVMGMDRRPSDGDIVTRTDTMFVLTIDPANDTARGLAMPRDLWVKIPTNESGSKYIEERINTAFEIGESGDLPGGGPGTVKRTVENLLGIPIDHYVLIDFEGFKEVINLLGGIDVDVPEPGVDDPFYSETERLGDYYPCVFEPGFYHMDGSQALCYSRVRRNSSDLDRILRQQRVIFAMMDKAKQLNFISSPDAMINLWKKYKDTVRTDISDLQVPGYAGLASKIDEGSLAFLSIGAATTPWTTPAGAAVLLPSEAGIKQIVDAFLSDSQLAQEKASIEVQNATGTDDQAQKAVDYFTSLGVSNAQLTAVEDLPPVAQTEIIVFTGKDYTAKRLASWLELPSARVRPSTPADAALNPNGADIVVVLGADAKLESAKAGP